MFADAWGTRFRSTKHALSGHQRRVENMPQILTLWLSPSSALPHSRLLPQAGCLWGLPAISPSSFRFLWWRFSSQETTQLVISENLQITKPEDWPRNEWDANTTIWLDSMVDHCGEIREGKLIIGSPSERWPKRATTPRPRGFVNHTRGT